MRNDQFRERSRAVDETIGEIVCLGQRGIAAKLNSGTGKNTNGPIRKSACARA
jgi:hypothetical protein